MITDKKSFIKYLNLLYGEINDIIIGSENCLNILPENEHHPIHMLKHDIRDDVFVLIRNKDIGYNGVGPAPLHYNCFKEDYLHWLREYKLNRILKK